jgi:ribonuclease BN (tRNA processing enzyme)
VDEPLAPIHLTAAQAGDAAREAGASRLLVTHVGDGHDRDRVEALARARFDGDVVVVEPGLVFDIA